ncbi:MAG TPA: hypothetical protein VGH56_07135, partial [Solirubrobacteraceae bacterium]
AGTSYGGEKTFTTLLGSAPVIDSESVSSITPTDATLEAAINTEGFETAYEFHLTAPPCPEQCEHLQHVFTLPSGKLLGSFVAQSVSLDLNSAGVSLSAGDSYEYWVTATSTAGTAQGHFQVFTAPFLAPQSVGISTPPTTNGTSHSGSATTPTGSDGSSSTTGVTPLGSPVVCLCDCARGCHGKKHLTRAQMLARALKACAKRPKSERASCRKQAHEFYSPAPKKKGHLKKK